MAKPKGRSVFGPGGIHVVFDPKDADTPCMVYLGECSATFECALSEGVEDVALSDAQERFLAQLEDEAAAFYDAYTHNNG